MLCLENKNDLCFLLFTLFYGMFHQILNDTDALYTAKAKRHKQIDILSLLMDSTAFKIAFSTHVSAIYFIY